MLEARKEGRMSKRMQWLLLLSGAALIFLAFDKAGNALRSGRGEAGWFLCALVVGLALALEVGGFRRTAKQVLRDLGFGRPRIPGIAAAGVIGSLLALFFPAYSSRTGVPITLRSDWLILLPGLFAQHGLAEETLFRGLVFRHLRTERSFWRAATLSMLFFVVAHLWLFTYLPALIALTSTLLAVITAFPMAALFERGGNTVWGPALVHFAIHFIKLADIPEAEAMPLTLIWMAMCAVIPFLVFLFKDTAR